MKTKIITMLTLMLILVGCSTTKEKDIENIRWLQEVQARQDADKMLSEERRAISGYNQSELDFVREAEAELSGDFSNSDYVDPALQSNPGTMLMVDGVNIVYEIREEFTVFTPDSAFGLAQALMELDYQIMVIDIENMPQSMLDVLRPYVVALPDPMSEKMRLRREMLDRISQQYSQ